MLANNEEELAKSQPKVTGPESKTKSAPAKKKAETKASEPAKSVAVPSSKDSKAPEKDKTSEAGSPKLPAAASSFTVGKLAGKLKPHGPNKKLIYGVIGGVVALVVVVAVVFGVLIYGYKNSSPVVKKVAAVVPYPVMSVNGSFVSYHEYLFELASIEQYYKSQTGADGKPVIDFATADGKSKLAQLKTQLMTQLKTDEVTRQLIKKNKISITNKELTTQYNTLVSSAGGADKLKDVLTKVYGWTPADLKRKLKFQLEKQALQTKITSDPTAEATAKATAQGILDKLKAGADFATLAKQKSQDTSAANGGDLGFVAKGQTGDTALETAAFALPAGQVSSSPVKSQYGYEIVKNIEFNADQTQVHIGEILIKTIDFNTYLSGQVDKAKVSTYFKS